MVLTPKSVSVKREDVKRDVALLDEFSRFTFHESR